MTEVDARPPSGLPLVVVVPHAARRAGPLEDGLVLLEGPKGRGRARRGSLGFRGEDGDRCQRHGYDQRGHLHHVATLSSLGPGHFGGGLNTRFGYLVSTTLSLVVFPVSRITSAAPETFMHPPRATPPSIPSPRPSLFLPLFTEVRVETV